MPDRPVTLITGTSRGVGRFLAEHYVERGHVVVGCSRGPQDWSHERYEHHALDVADEDSVQRLFARVRTRGRLDHVVNNAGVAMLNHALLTPASAVASTLATNVLGTFLVCREAARAMRRRRFGRIVNLSTTAVPLKLEGEASYAASKAAVVSLTEVLARELAPFGVTVNAVGPGPLDTDLTRGVPRATLDRLLDRHALRRLTTFADVANVVDFLLAPESGMVTGQTVYLGGP
ncbi:MAG TPA: SDR family oxidoreductase [Conexibacter sp.]|nr:SDR family oxidoreductase [Conexibacter sp.]